MCLLLDFAISLYILQFFDNFSMGLFELISHIIFPNEYDFDGEYFRGEPIFNQPQLLGKFPSECWKLKNV